MSYLKMNFNDAYRSRIYPEDLIILDELSENINKTGENFQLSNSISRWKNKQIVEIGQPLKKIEEEK
jgi:hypothetical protein